MGNQLVLAFFTNEDEADYAVNEIKGWDKASKDVKLGAIGVLVKDEKGKIKTHKLGAPEGQDRRGPLRPGRTPDRRYVGAGRRGPRRHLRAPSSTRGWGCPRRTWPASTAT